MKMRYLIKTITLTGFLAVSNISAAAERKSPINTSSPQPASPIAQLFSPLKILYSPTCLLICVRPPGRPERCRYDREIPQCAVLNYK